MPAPSKLRVLHVTTVHQPLDTRIYYKEVRALADSGVDVRLATTVDRAGEAGGVVLLPLGSREGSRWRRLARDLRALLTIYAHQDAIVHIHDPELLLVAALPAFAGWRVVYDVHEFYYERIEASQWIPKPLRQFAAKLYGAVERSVLPRFAGVVIVSEAMRPRYERLVPMDRVALVRNFPNLDSGAVTRARTTPHPLAGRPYVLHTGGAMRLRAFDDLVAAAEYLQQSSPELAMVVLGTIDLGEYPPEERPKLLERAERAGVVMLGNVAYDEAQQWLAHARIGYMPLADTENNRRGTPNKLFEYALFELPIVASRIGRIAEIVESHDLGALVPIGDGAAHGAALARIHANEAEHARYAERSRQAAREFSFDAECLTLRALYDRICTSESTPRSVSRCI